MQTYIRIHGCKLFQIQIFKIIGNNLFSILKINMKLDQNDQKYRFKFRVSVYNPRVMGLRYTWGLRSTSSKLNLDLRESKTEDFKPRGEILFLSFLSQKTNL